MLNRFCDFLSSVILYIGVALSKVKFSKRTGVSIKKRLSITQMSLKEGDQYRLGEATVTLAKFGIEGKQEVAKKIAAADARRAERKRILTARAEEMMLMKPEELLQFQIEKWVSERKSFSEKVSGLRKLSKEESEREQPPPSEKTA